MSSRPAALGISIHTGWGACVVVAGTPSMPEVLVNERIQILGDDERFCFHMAAEMKRAEAAPWLARLRRKALATARRAAHPRIHTAEGCFYRDVLAEACPIPVRIVLPATLDASRVGKIAPPPRGKDQRLAALAAWSLIAQRGPRTSALRSTT
jgi:hypothetical protein